MKKKALKANMACPFCKKAKVKAIHLDEGKQVLVEPTRPTYVMLPPGSKTPEMVAETLNCYAAHMCKPMRDAKKADSMGKYTI